MSHVDFSGPILGATSQTSQPSIGNSLMSVVQPLDNSTPSYHNINSMMSHSNHSNIDHSIGGGVMNQTFNHHHHVINQSSQQLYGISSVSESNQYSVNGNTRSATIPTLINGSSLKNNNSNSIPSSNNSALSNTNHQQPSLNNSNVYHCLNPSISGMNGSTSTTSNNASQQQIGSSHAAPISSPHHFTNADQQPLNSDPMNSVINRSLSSYSTQSNSLINPPATSNLAAVEQQGFSKNEAPNPNYNYNQWPTTSSTPPFYNSSVVQSHIGTSITNSGNNSVVHNNLVPNTASSTSYANLYHHQTHSSTLKSAVTNNENSLIANDHHYSSTGSTSQFNQNNAMTSAANCTSNNGSIISSSYNPIPINQSCSPSQVMMDNSEYQQQQSINSSNNHHIPNPKVDSNDPSNISLHSSPTFSYNTFNTANSLTSQKDSPSTSTVDLNDEKINPEKETPYHWKISDFKRSVFYELIHDYEMKRARIYLLQHFPYYDSALMTTPNLFEVSEDEIMKVKNNDLKEILVDFDEVQFLLYLYVGRRVDAYGVLTSMINNGLVLNDNKYSSMLFDYSSVASFSPEESITILKSKIEIFLNKYGVEEEQDYSPLGIKMQSLEQKLELEQPSEDEDSGSDCVFLLSEEEDEYEPHLRYYNNCYQNYIPEVYYRPASESPNSNSNSNDNPYDLSLSNTDSSSFSPSLVKKSKKKQSSRDSDRSSSDSQEDDEYMPPAGGGISKKGKLKKKRRSNAKRACHHCRRSHLRCTNVRPCCRCLARGLDCYDIE